MRTTTQSPKPGQTVHFTNWPGKPSRPVKVVRGAHWDGGGVEVEWKDGETLCVFADEITWTPRAGLEVDE